MTTKSWTVVIVTLTLLVCGCSHTERRAMRAPAIAGLTAITPTSEVPSVIVEVPQDNELLTVPGDFPLPTQPTASAPAVDALETMRPIVVEELPPLPLIT